ncbi:hypothetical protein DYB30_008273, partial [Aphanomyces astaci]
DMNMSEADVEALAASLINDNILATRKIDQRHKVLVVVASSYVIVTTSRDVSTKTVDALAKWTAALAKLNASMAERGGAISST